MLAAHAGSRRLSLFGAQRTTPPNSRGKTVCIAALLGLPTALGCSGARKGSANSDPTQLQPRGRSSEPATAVDAPDSVQLELGPVTKASFREHPAKAAWVFEPGTQPREMDIGQAEARGYTVVDLSNAWVPYIFSEKTPGLDDKSKNRYKNIYVGLANDKSDSDGDRLPAHARNYLELYGIPPSLAVIKKEWDEHEGNVNPCLEQAGFNPEVFTSFDGKIVYSRSGQSKRLRSAQRYASKLKTQMRRVKLKFDNPDDREAAATHPKTASTYKKWRTYQAEVDVITHAQIRFRCERLFNSKSGEGKFKPGVYDSATTHALANFERKHDIMGWGHFKRDNLDMLATTPDEASHQRLLRAVAERVVTSAGIVEDGSALAWKGEKFQYRDDSGTSHGLRNVVDEHVQAAVKALDLTTPQSARTALAMLSDLGEGNFEQLLVAIKMPPKPPYYADNMSFSAVIDRGDVWYDFPYTEEGRKIAQPRRRFPHLTLYVHYLDQKIPLVHWRTTIGSWRNELVEGEVMLKYKNSDIGPRVWKDIVAAPVWIPPPSTPTSELIKSKWRNGKFTRDVNYDTIGPGFRSAYGLVAAYHIKQAKDEEGNITAELDNSIRTHGSVDYMSILRRFSHGCHRLYNMDAVRMFSFVLRHSDYQRVGQIPVGVGRYLEHEEETYHMKISSRGYKYELVDPIPITVTKGRIRGSRKFPHSEPILKPLTPEQREAEAAAALEAAEETVSGIDIPWF